MPSDLDSPVQYLKGVGPARAEDFAKLGIETIRDILFTFPRRLSDRSNIQQISNLQEGDEAAVLVRPLSSRESRVRGGRMSLVTMRVSDGTGTLEAIWFNCPWIAKQLMDQEVLLYGKVKRGASGLKMDHPHHEVVQENNDSLSIGRVVPIYPCTGGLSQKVWLKIMQNALELHGKDLTEFYPDEYLRKMEFPCLSQAVHAMHFPTDGEAHEAAWRRLAFDESLFMQLAIGMRRHAFEEELPGRAFSIQPELDVRIRKLFPFPFTAAQNKCIAEISSDMTSRKPMHRLLQGDVGSGKTAVALYAMLAAVASGAQACLMVPTSILAQQHFLTIEKFLANSKHNRVRVELMCGGLNEKERERLRMQLATGTIDILIATHAAIEENVQFKDLGLVVIDEQHKFGVGQRTALAGKGTRPDILVMTATPIPRSLALTVYGDLDVSVIDSLPPGRKPVKTTVPDTREWPKVWEFVRREISRGHQAFIISPLVDENPDLELQSATEAFEHLQNEELHGCRLALLHGKMKREEQQETMGLFREGAIQALICTVVVEVGVDIPNATTMVILHADRFGLAQLHQLRGRVGRGGLNGYFFLLSDAQGDTARKRLSVLEDSADGFKISEEDLKLRGPGQFLGTRQHGLPELKLVDISRDFAMILQTRDEARRILQKDPQLRAPSHRSLREELKRFMAKSESPDVGIG